MIQKYLIVIFCLLCASCASKEAATEIPPCDNTPCTTAKPLPARPSYHRAVLNDKDNAAKLQTTAEQGDAAAQSQLAFLYLTGKGVLQNSTTAFEWYEKAANQGLASAQYNLGLMYKNGVGTAKDPAKAKEWMDKATSNGFNPRKGALGAGMSQIETPAPVTQVTQNNITLTTDKIDDSDVDGG